MNCPKCRNALLLPAGHGSPDICRECGGMWIANPDHSAFAESGVEAAMQDGGGNDHDGRTGLCPAGHGIMIRARVDIEKPFFLERCTDCGGVWFDKGEWDRIARHNLGDQLGNIWSRSWQRRQRAEKNREAFLDTNRRLLGRELFDSILALAHILEDHPERLRAIALLQQETRAEND